MRRCDAAPRRFQSRSARRYCVRSRVFDDRGRSRPQRKVAIDARRSLRETHMTELDYWTQQIKKGRINRREFMGRAAALGLTTALATSLLAKAGIAATPKKGGSARFGLAHGATTDTLDPTNWPDTGTQVPFWGGMSNSLTEIDADGNITPDLAESMEPGDDAKSWIFKLRKGLTFHNGKNVTTDDVIASYQHHMKPDSKSAAKANLAAITNIKGDGKDTVIFTLSGGDADFPYKCSDYHLPIMPAKP